ncbi:hypothetical protein [Bacillus sp. FJAT-27251]|uniref:hypothetical protein n=1 Tax=Bacillus sp. FJAT-27251 TaxID=1684142 RepID=UPI0006A7F00D|nr:hypothetical protein [Bacillus sp. FJAT-27251]
MKKELGRNILGAVVCLLLFTAGMIFVEQTWFFILIGMAGLAGFSFFIYRLVLGTLRINEK